MKCPPYLVRLRIEEPDQTRLRLWLPLFLLWPLLLVLLAVAVVVTLLADLISLLTLHRPVYTRLAYTRLLLGIVGLLGETRGTEVFIEDRDRTCRTVILTLR